MHAPEPDHLPSLTDEQSQLMDVALHVIDEQFQVATRFEEKADRQWRLVAFVVPLANTTAFAAIAAKGLSAGAGIALGVGAIVTATLMGIAMKCASSFQGATKEKRFNASLLRAMTDDLAKRDHPRFTGVARAKLTKALAEIAKERTAQNDDRYEAFKKVLWASTAAWASAVVLLVLSGVFVFVTSL